MSASGKLYELHLAYGSSKTIITRIRLKGGAVPKQESRIYGFYIPAGSTVYYKLKCETGGATLNLHLRYHYHNNS